ncbi:hypothetical protein CR513_42384, partial [Mucuna pruriens]
MSGIHKWCSLDKLGHASLRLISKLKKHNLVKGLPSLKEKHIRGSFESKNDVSTSRFLELLHIDLFEPTKTALLAVDDYSKWTWVMFLAYKDESFKVLILPLSKVIIRENLKMKTFNSFMKNMEFIIIFLVQELLNLTFLISTLLGFYCFILNTKDNLGKFDSKSDKGTFIGYSTMSKAYKVYNPRTLKVEESIHPDKELLVLTEPFAKLNIEKLQSASKELLLDDKPKIDEILGNIENRVRTRSTFKDQSQIALLLEVEPKNVEEALLDDRWILFQKNDVWKLVFPLKDKSIIGTKWIFRNKLDENDKGIDFIENFVPIARLEVICTLLSFATHLIMRLHQMDVKGAFLNGIINEVFVKQLPSFNSDTFPNHVFRLKKALYGLKQAPRAWYEKSFLMTNDFQRGKVDITLFHKNYDSHFIILQIYKAEDGIYIHQTKYVKELLKKFNREDSKTMFTPMHLTSILSLDESDKKVDQTS